VSSRSRSIPSSDYPIPAEDPQQVGSDWSGPNPPHDLTNAVRKGPSQRFVARPSPPVACTQSR
jgi:hypothetical protein